MEPITTRTRILCPECKGHKVMMYDICAELAELYGWRLEREERPCETCSGEGIVEEVKTIEYKRI